MRTFGRIVIVLLLVGLVAAVGFGIWNAGYDQGVIDSAESTTDIVVTTDRGFFPFGAIFGLFFLFLLFGLVFKFAFGWRRWGGHYKAMGPGGYREQMERRMTEWHEQAHGRAPPSDEPTAPAGPVS